MITQRLKKALSNMKRRCYNPAAKDYRFYGAKGITICEEWLENPYKFYTWALDNGYTDELTIDRIDPKKSYCPENCRWIEPKTNSKIKSTTRVITVDGISDSLSGWARRLNIPKMTMVHRGVKHTDEEMEQIIKKEMTNE